MSYLNGKISELGSDLNFLSFKTFLFSSGMEYQVITQ